MDVRTAILKAADSIERFPHLFNFGAITNGDLDCGTPGCAIGWIASHANIGRKDSKGETFWVLADDELYRFIGGTPDSFYNRMDGIAGSFNKWANNADDCARTLRLYADKYHPEAYPIRTGIPAEVRELFEKVAA